MQEVGSDVTVLALAFVDHAFDSMMNKDSVVVDKAFEEVMCWMLVDLERVLIGKWRKPCVPKGAGRIRILIDRLA